jgi:hypothetical protein
MDINDPAIYNVWDRITELLSENLESTVGYLIECNEKEIEYLSSVFEDVAVNLNDRRYIESLKFINNKFPKLELDAIIKTAEEYTM